MPATLLFSNYELGPLRLPNRIVMAPMTRCRVDSTTLAPTELTATYYAQRATAGLIVSEGIMVSEQARGYCETPGLYNDEQVLAWKRVTEAVHLQGGRIVAQLWHCGRISHAALQPDAGPPVGPGNIRADCKVFLHDANSGAAVLEPCSPPRALQTHEVGEIQTDFVLAAERAILAGFDGVEIHAANGYLFDQFRCPYLNHRSDRYGGTLENRNRFLLETSAAVSAAVGEACTGVRLSPLGIANDMHFDPDPQETYGYLARELDRIGIHYLHLNQQDARWMHDAANPLLRRIRTEFTRSLILCGGFTRAVAESTLRSGAGDLIAFGRPFISNPDLVARLQHHLTLTPFDPGVFYAGGIHGYTDYPRFPRGDSRSAESPSSVVAAP